MENLKIGEFIKPLDEEYIYQIYNIDEDSYIGQSIISGHNRYFGMDKNHYRVATEDEIKTELENSNLRFSYWIANKKDEIISNGFIIARGYERAREIFNNNLRSMKSYGDYFLSEIPECFIKDFS